MVCSWVNQGQVLHAHAEVSCVSGPPRGAAACRLPPCGVPKKFFMGKHNPCHLELPPRNRGGRNLCIGGVSWKLQQHGLLVTTHILNVCNVFSMLAAFPVSGLEINGGSSMRCPVHPCAFLLPLPQTLCNYMMACDLWHLSKSTVAPRPCMNRRGQEELNLWKSSSISMMLPGCLCWGLYPELLLIALSPCR